MCRVGLGIVRSASGRWLGCGRENSEEEKEGWVRQQQPKKMVIGKEDGNYIIISPKIQELSMISN